MKVVEMVRGAIKAQWAFSLVLVVTVFTAWLLIANGHHGLEAAAYKFAVVIIGGLATKSVLAASVRAYPTMFFDDRGVHVPCWRCTGGNPGQRIQGFGSGRNAPDAGRRHRNAVWRIAGAVPS